MPLDQAPRSHAVSRAEFHRRLRSWLDDTDESIVGPNDVPGVTPWLHVRDNDRLFALHADTTRDAVRRYMDLVSLHGDELKWEVTTSRRGNPTALLYGPQGVRHTPFYFYVLA